MLESSSILTAIVVALLAVSEALAFIPSVKANGIFQFVLDILKKILGRE